MSVTNNENEQSNTDSKYEKQHILNQYLLLHFGTYQDTLTHSLLPQDLIGFPARCAQLLCEKMQEQNIKCNRVLDLGCAVGGASFELSKSFAEVTGIDLSELFITTANKIKNEGKITYQRKEEGNLYTDLNYHLDPQVNRKVIQFQVGDACALSSDLGQFDAVLIANLLCRLPNPADCLAQLTSPNGILRSGGLLVITSPYSWLKEFTPEKHWFNQQSTNSITNLHSILEDRFELIFEDNYPFIIREHARKFEYIIAHATVWKCK